MMLWFAIIALAVFGGYFLLRNSSAELGPVVDTPTAGRLSAEEVAAFEPLCSEVASETVALVLELEKIASYLGEDRNIEAADLWVQVEEQAESLPEICGQAEEFSGGSPEPMWWSEHCVALAEKMARADAGGVLSSGQGGPSAAGSIGVAIDAGDDIALACDDFARRMLGQSAEQQVAAKLGNEAARRFAKGVRAAKKRETP